MKWIDLTFLTPHENLACDEALLDLCENGFEDEVLRFWQPSLTFVVLGYSRKYRSDVHVANCRKHQIPILRRPSGGGTVLQGPGCFNFSLVLKIGGHSFFRDITKTNLKIMQRHQEVAETLLGKPVQIQGVTDLTLENLKFSGNAQRRKRRYLLFHGSFLLKADISLMEKLLKIPRRQPAYRQNRSHREFLTNIDILPNSLKDALKKSWGAQGALEEIPSETIQSLVREKYSREEWNFKF
jgi:lipoate-protein ligase A